MFVATAATKDVDGAVEGAFGGGFVALDAAVLVAFEELCDAAVEGGFGVGVSGGFGG